MCKIKQKSRITEWSCLFLQRNAEGKELFDEICERLNINEKEYFGLTYTGAQDVKVEAGVRQNTLNLSFFDYKKLK